MECSYPGCGRPMKSKTLCVGHRRQVLHDEELRPIPRRIHANKGRECSFDPCGKPAISRGLCTGHRSQQRRGSEMYALGDPDVSRRKRQESWAALTPQERRARVEPMLRVPYERTDEWCKRMSITQTHRWGKGFTFTERNCVGCGQPFMPSSGVHRWCTIECRKKHRLARSYGISLRQLLDIESRQGGRCALCGAATRLYIDHCHKTGAVRGLLCNHCNTGLGKFRDDSALLAAAIQYLARVP